MSRNHTAPVIRPIAQPDTEPIDAPICAASCALADTYSELSSMSTSSSPISASCSDSSHCFTVVEQCGSCRYVGHRVQAKVPIWAGSYCCAMDQRTRLLWQKQDVHGGDRKRLFTAVRAEIGDAVVLYPGSYVDMAASFVFSAVIVLSDRTCCRKTRWCATPSLPSWQDASP